MCPNLHISIGILQEIRREGNATSKGHYIGMTIRGSSAVIRGGFLRGVDLSLVGGVCAGRKHRGLGTVGVQIWSGVNGRSVASALRAHGASDQS